MSKLIITRGLPGSGKSTWAREQVKLHSFKRVNRDDLRAMIDPEWSQKKEEFTVGARNTLIAEALRAGYSVISDDTNLSNNVVDELTTIALDAGATVEIKSFLDVPIETCIARDLSRKDKPNEHYVGEKVIRLMVKQHPHLFPNNTLRATGTFPPLNDKFDAVVVDVDGTLALFDGQRSPYDTAKAANDRVNEPVAMILRLLARQQYLRADRYFHIIICSGREAKYEQLTRDWLKANDIPFTYLYMRETGDRRKDAVIKREIYERDIAPHYNVLFVFDDRDQVVRQWRELGLTVFQVAEGNF